MIAKDKVTRILKTMIYYFIFSVAILSYILWSLHFYRISLLFFSTLIVLFFSLFFARKKRILLSVFLLTNIFSIFFILLSLFNPLIYSDLLFYISTRFSILFLSVIPVLIFSPDKKKKLIYVSLIPLFIFITYDLWHKLFSVIPTYYDKRLLYFNFAFFSAFVFIYMLIFLYQKNINDYELIILNNQKQLKEINTRLTSSINYARRIQSFLLKDEKVLSFFSDYFIINLPQSTVSGDFFWIKEKNNKIYILLGDCTGHGVPGALLTMLFISFLDNLYFRIEHYTAAEILTILRDKVITLFSNSGDDKKLNEGMDASLVIYDKDTGKVNYSGAHNPLLFISGKQIIKYRATATSISISPEKIDIKDVYFQAGKNDLIYLFSDGYIDQLSEKYQKFTVSRLKKLLLEINKLGLNEQKKLLIDNFESWRGKMRQIDDILIIGIRI